MLRLNSKGEVVARGEYKDLEQALLTAGVRSAVLWDLVGLIEGYAEQGVTITEREAELRFSVWGDAIQEEASRAGQELAKRLIRSDVQTRRSEAGETN
jgi:hypothetical protein